MKESLSSSLESHFESIDEYLWQRQKVKFGSSTRRPVWSDLDEEDIAALVRVWTKLGARWTPAAEAARLTTESADYVSVFVAYGPRIRETVKIIRETWIPARKRGESRDES